MNGQSCDKILVTGSTGFVGQALVERLGQQGKHIVCAARRHQGYEKAETVIVGEVDQNTDWTTALIGVKKVIHLAAQVLPNPDQPHGQDWMTRTNVAGTRHLAEQAAIAGVKRFIFLSSMKVFGSESQSPFKEEDSPCPDDGYGRSKLQAEQALHHFRTESSMEVVIIRPPLVYGPGVKGNFRKLTDLVCKPVPLPLGGIRNMRSYIALDNLVSFITICAEHPAAANEIFHVSDGNDLSTPDLLRLIGQAMGRDVRLLPIPQCWLTLTLKALGQAAMAKRLVGCLQADITKAIDRLGWQPPLTVNEGLCRMVGRLKT